MFGVVREADRVLLSKHRSLERAMTRADHEAGVRRRAVRVVKLNPTRTGARTEVGRRLAEHKFSTLRIYEVRQLAFELERG